MHMNIILVKTFKLDDKLDDWVSCYVSLSFLFVKSINYLIFEIDCIEKSQNYFVVLFLHGIPHLNMTM